MRILQQTTKEWLKHHISTWLILIAEKLPPMQRGPFGNVNRIRGLIRADAAKSIQGELQFNLFQLVYANLAFVEDLPELLSGIDRLGSFAQDGLSKEMQRTAREWLRDAEVTPYRNGWCDAGTFRFQGTKRRVELFETLTLHL